MDQRIDTLTHANQQAHDAIGLRIDGVRNELGQRIEGVRSELGQRIDRVHSELGERIDAQSKRIDKLEARLARTSEDVSFIKGRLTSQPEN